MARRPYSVNSCEGEAAIRFNTEYLMLRNNNLHSNSNQTSFKSQYTDLQLLQIILLYVLWQIVNLEKKREKLKQKEKAGTLLIIIRPNHCTCTELVMVLSAKIVAQSFTVDWLSKAPWVSINTTATCRRRDGSTGHTGTNGSCMFYDDLLSSASVY